MSGKIRSKIFCICAIVTILGSSLFAITPYGNDYWNNVVEGEKPEQNTTPSLDDLWSPNSVTDSSIDDSLIIDKELNDNDYLDVFDPMSIFQQYQSCYSTKVSYTTDYYQSDGAGFQIDYEVERNHLFITATIGSYHVVTYTYEEGTYNSVQINGAETLANYGEPALPYKNLILSIPEGASVLGTDVTTLDIKTIDELEIIPGPEPLEVSSIVPTVPTMWFNPLAYSMNEFTPSERVRPNEVGITGQPCLYLTINPLTYNPDLDQGRLALQMRIEVTFDKDVTLQQVLSVPQYQFDYEVGGNYVFIIDSSFAESVTDFAEWKTSLGWDVQITSVQDIYSSYPGSDHAEELRNYIIDEYDTNGTLYYLFVGDCDIVPAREVWDPAAGPGLDNGTEPSDLYFECLDGDWNLNGNDLYGEMADDVDFFPEVMVGRLPVQTTSEAEKLLASIISIESNPEPGSWIDNFMLIAPDCFGSGDGVNMVEEVLNQKHLVGSFFDTYRFYPTDGSLSNSAVIDRINSGVSLIDFFDHGAYDVWVGALTVAEALALTNGNRSALAFGMACETAAFDMESYEPVIGEALLRAPNGGLHTYIAATRVAWAGYHCFDGFHNRFWDLFFTDIFDDRVASPKIAFHAALNEMATIFDVNTDSTRETIYQAIYFGDPTLHMSWKQDITTEATEVGMDEEVTLNGTCLQFQSGIPLTGQVNVTVRDPIRRIVYDGYPTLDIDGEYSVIFNTNELAGNYSVETYVWNPFSYMAVTEFIVGNPSMTLQLDSSPIYYTNLSFSGMTPFDGAGNVFLTDLDGTVLETMPITSTSNIFNSQINVSGFGWLKLYVHINSSSQECGKSLIFKVSHGDILVISDITGGGGPSYPGGWPLSNYGDSGNYGELREALEDEYEVIEWRIMFDGAPNVTYLHEFDAVLVSMGDANGGPLVSYEASIIDVLQQYHEEGGNLLFEGGSFLTFLNSSHSSYFATLFHVTYTSDHSNTGNLYLDSGGHPITSGIPSTLFLDDGLGSDYVEIFTPIGDSQHVAGYSGSYSGGTAISAIAANGTHGAVVVIGFAIDAIQEEEHRYQLIENSVGYLLHPTLMVTLSDYALLFGTNDTIFFNISEAATETPLGDALITLSGCGVSATNDSQADGSCSIFVNATSFGEIMVEVSKPGFLNFSTVITIYDKPIIVIETDPLYVKKGITQNLTIIISEYYEGVPLEGCAVNLTGCGVSVTGITNSSGLLDLTINPTIEGRMLLNVTCSGYVNSTILVDVPINVLVLPSLGTEFPEIFAWDDLNSDWNLYGDIPVIIDYTSLTSSPFTFTDLVNINADVLVRPYAYSIYSEEEINAIISYVEMGHGFIITSNSIYSSPDVLAPFLGIVESATYDSASVESMDIIDQLHPVMNNVANPYEPGYPYISYYPSGTGWESSALNGADFLAVDESVNRYGAITTYRGMIYFSNVPEIYSNNPDKQIIYNALIWSEYVIPEHDLSVRLETPQWANPNSEVLVNATVVNGGLNDEEDITLELYIEDILVDSLFVASIQNGTSQTLTYVWEPVVEMVYNVTTKVTEVTNEFSTRNNVATRMVNVSDIHDYYEIETQGIWYDAVANGVNLGISGDDTSGYVDFPFDFNYYDNTFDRVYISSNGWLSFTNPDPYEFFAPPFPSTDSDHAYCLAPYWADLQADGNIYAWITEDMVVIQYNDYRWLGGENLGTFQVVFHLEGTIEMNYQVMYSAYYGTVGLNHGNGFHYNIYPSASLEGVTDFSLVYMYDIPEHEIALGLSVPSYVDYGSSTTISCTAINLGMNTETDVHLFLYIDEVIVDEEIFTEILVGESFALDYFWNPLSRGEYNITAYVIPVDGEVMLSNNLITRFVHVIDEREFTILEPLNGSTVEGGLVYVAFEWIGRESPQYITVSVNYWQITEYPYSGIDEFIVPIFRNGTNEIRMVVEWTDENVTIHTAMINSVNVLPLIRPVAGDHANYKIEAPWYTDHYNFTFESLSSEFWWDVDLLLAEVNPITGEIESTRTEALTVNILNGFISTSVSMAGTHLFWLTGINAPMSVQKIAEIGDHGLLTQWENVFTICEEDAWYGIPSWLMESEISTSEIEVLAPNSILAELRDITHGINYYLMDSSFIPEMDETPPEWDVTPTDQIAEYGDSFAYTLHASDNQDIIVWVLNDTTYFEIGSDGVIQNKSFVPIGLYPIQATVYDGFMNNIDAIFTIEVTDTCAPYWNPNPTNQFLEYGHEFSYQLEALDLSGIDRWEINDTTHFSVNQSGLLTNITLLPVGTITLEISVYDVYENYNSSTIAIIISDTTAPSWITSPTNITLDYGQELHMQLSAYDLSGIASWTVDDTSNFNIDQTGLLTNASILDSGIYNLTVTISDASGNTQTANFTVTVEQSTTTPPEPFDFITMAIIVVLGGALGIGIFIIIIRSPLSKRFRKE